MTGLELLQNAMKRRPVPRTPWVPFVGCHGGALIDVSAREYLRSLEHLVNGIRRAIKIYTPDGIPIGFDLQIEAEALGCNLVWADENPPAVASHPLAEGKTLEDFHVPANTEGRIPLFLNAARSIRAEFPDIALYGVITGPFTLAMHLQGTDLFMSMYEDPEYVTSLLAFCRDVSITMADYYIDAGCDVIAVVDPLTSQIGTEQFVQFISNPAKEIFNHIREKNRFGSFFVCGHARQNIRAMAECHPDNISIDENIPLDFVKQVCDEHGISFGGNLQLTVTLLLGSAEDAQRNAMDCIITGGDTGFVLAPGCDLPYSTPPENLIAISKLVKDPYQQQIIVALEHTNLPDDLPDMSEYGAADKVIVDIITLDSESCAPCQYMVEAVKQVAPYFNNIVEWREHKIKYRDSIQFMTALMVKNIPTICIDGEITFVSRIPAKEELIKAIQKKINAKFYHKLRMNKGSLLILGKNADEINMVKPSVITAMKELGADLPVIEITNDQEIKSYGVSRTPAVISVTYKIKSEEKIPSVIAIKEWIKDLI